MLGNNQAFGLIACIVGTAAILFICSRRSPSRRRVCGSIGLAAVTFLGAAVLSFHMCLRGQPFTQMLIPSLCVLIVVMFVERAVIRRVVALTLIVASVTLSVGFAQIVHLDHYTGNPDSVETDRNHAIYYLNSELSKVVQSDSALSAGWLRDVLAPFSIPDAERVIRRLDRLNELGVARRTWHTWLTGIYQVESTHADVWFTGGIPGSSVTQLDVRPRQQ